MRYLWLSEAQARQILAHAEAGSPYEVCGLIFGREGRAEAVIPVTNVAGDALHHYQMDTYALSEHLPAFARQGLDLIGLYHSHPRGAPIPSHTDIAQATYPRTAYLIAGLGETPPRLAAWLIENGRVESLPLHVGGTPPEEGLPDALSPAQRFAVICGALLAVAILLALSLSLLPPAPIIPS